MINYRQLAIAVLSGAALSASAHSIALSENFNGELQAWQTNFPVLLELDHSMPLPNFNPLFQDSNGVARPWWKLKDTDASEDGFLGSHSAYSPAGASNDWIVSRAVEIPTEGYTLTFGAQSYEMRGSGRLSDLWVFITEYQPSEGNVPTEAAMHIENVPTGKKADVIEKDFTSYSLSLDAYAGKTIYISFANLNNDKDILCIDDVQVMRPDIAGLTATAPDFVEKGNFKVSAIVEASAGETVKNWKLVFDAGNGKEPVTIAEGAELKAGTPVSYDAEGAIAADQTCEWTLTLTADDMQPVVAKGSVTGLDFMPWHKVLLEEATGMWCGNCPLGIYALENMSLHEEMKDYVIPVSIHITQSGDASDYLKCEDYAYMSSLNIAPAMRIDRSREVTMFAIEHDGNPIDLNNTLSVAYKVKKVHETPAMMNVKVTGEYVIEGNDTTAIRATVRLTPARTLEGNHYRVGFALTENNVGFDPNPMFHQENYFAGSQLASKLGGFTELPGTIRPWRFQDVARAVYDFHGHEDIVLPETLEMSKDYEYSVTLPIPDTRRFNEGSDGSKTQLSPAIVASNLCLVAFVLDEPAGFTAVNSDMYPMTEEAEKKLTIADLVKMSGVSAPEAEDYNAPAEYYNLQGIRILNPTNGLYIEKRGSKTRKIIINN